MDWKFSATTNGFYPSNSLGDYLDLPTDLVDVTSEQYDELQLAQSRDGKRIIADEVGFPVSADKLPPTQAELQQTRDGLLQFAGLRIAPLQDAVDLEVATAAETAALTAWKRYRVDLSRIDLSAAPITWPTAPST